MNTVSITPSKSCDLLVILIPFRLFFQLSGVSKLLASGQERGLREGDLQAIMNMMGPTDLSDLEDEVKVIQQNVKAWILRCNYKSLRKAAKTLQVLVVAMVVVVWCSCDVTLFFFNVVWCCLVYIFCVVFVSVRFGLVRIGSDRFGLVWFGAWRERFRVWGDYRLEAS